MFRPGAGNRTQSKFGTPRVGLLQERAGIDHVQLPWRKVRKEIPATPDGKAFTMVQQVSSSAQFASSLRDLRPNRLKMDLDAQPIDQQAIYLPGWA